MQRTYCDECKTNHIEIAGNGSGHVVSMRGIELPPGWTRVAVVRRIESSPIAGRALAEGISLPDALREFLPTVAAHNAWSEELILCPQCAEPRVASLLPIFKAADDGYRPL
jgi:hypothetical protein